MRDPMTILGSPANGMSPEFPQRMMKNTTRSRGKLRKPDFHLHLGMCATSAARHTFDLSDFSPGVVFKNV